ncbi:MAG TPA: galactose-1-phosphate uridylyltransferase [Rhizomicrobium sp.]|nr:galactose-1-phosphate uridylyltransferase [Rhizomicrobium sp.]
MSGAPTSHLRRNLLTGEWVLVCPRRGGRPQSEKSEAQPPACELHYDPGCYLCPGNTRATGAVNPRYTGIHAFDNDFPALSRDASGPACDPDSLLQSQPERGICRVMCYSGRHDLSPARLPVEALRKAVDAWTLEYRELGAIPWIGHVQIFENHGALGGASSRHPHSQIWASAHVPPLLASERHHQAEYGRAHGGCLLCDYLKRELLLGARTVCENEGFAALVPYWAVWPFETMVVAKRHYASLDGMSDPERGLLADIVKRLTARYDNLFNVPFPYSMAMHQAPTDGEPHPEWHFHLHYQSPMRSATAQKIMAGYELAAGRERDDLPEDAAARLRAAGETHYLDIAC